ncbi:MAG: hypothetical protein CMJ94_16055 [Planctomycetes bacterium]|nr:hypothetical protein [Planctomycetota bacterium]
MQISIDLELPELETVLADLLPAGIELRSLRLDRQQLRAGLQAPMVGACTLTAQVSQAGAGLILSRFDLEGAGLAKPLALGALRRKLAEVDRQSGPWRIWGESEGDRLQVSWRRG